MTETLFCSFVHLEQKNNSCALQISPKKMPGQIDSLHALKPVLADELTRLTGVYYILTRLAFLGALEEAREPNFAELVALTLEKCPWRIHASAQPTFSAIDLDLPLTRTKHQMCV